MILTIFGTESSFPNASYTAHRLVGINRFQLRDPFESKAGSKVVGGRPRRLAKASKKAAECETNLDDQVAEDSTDSAYRLTEAGQLC